MTEARTATRGGRGGAASDGGVAVPEQPPAACNEVHVVGRVSSVAQERELPSGDVLATWRVVVERPAPRRAAPEGVRLPSVDTVTCVAWTARLRRSAAGLAVGDVVEVHGALRSRYWRAAGGLGSRTEVEVERVRRLARA